MVVSGRNGVAPVLVRAARGEKTPHTPVWFMRQAGRYLPEYRAIRETHSLLEICARPELAAEVTLQPLRRFAADAAIIFADILLPVIPMGLSLRFAAGEGPVIDPPVRDAAGARALSAVDVDDALASTLDAIRLVRGELDAETAVVGFAGAPFTIASYMIEGGASRSFVETKRMMYSDPEAWDTLMRRITSTVAGFLAAQVRAGADVVQVFDSWVGALSPDDYRRYVLPYSSEVLRAAEATGAPVIHFGAGTATLLELMTEAGGDVIGLDWRVPLNEGWARIGGCAVQGNLDPIALFAPRDELARRVDDILARAGNRPGHLFNVGHGLVPNTDPAAVRFVVDRVHERSARQ
jgi:uroporphyrinogen decarboxylase